VASRFLENLCTPGLPDDRISGLPDDRISEKVSGGVQTDVIAFRQSTGMILRIS